jgi:hypothetical protein
MVILYPILRYDHPFLLILCITGMINFPSPCIDDGNVGIVPVSGLANH